MFATLVAFPDHLLVQMGMRLEGTDERHIVPIAVPGTQSDFGVAVRRLDPDRHHPTIGAAVDAAPGCARSLHVQVVAFGHGAEMRGIEVSAFAFSRYIN